MTSDLRQKKCEACEGIGQALTADQIKELMPQLDKQWEVSSDHLTLQRTFSFQNYYETMAFVNATAWLSHMENHHPDLNVGYKQCVVTYTTHALNGLTHNDFICAAKMDGLLVM